MTYPQPIQDLIDRFRRLPGVGPKSAERYALHLIRQSREVITLLIEQLAAVRDRLSRCVVCGMVTETDRCSLCNDSRRDHSILCVVAEMPDLLAIERTGEFRGLYHILDGLLSPIEGIGPEQLRVRELLGRVRGTLPPNEPTAGSGGLPARREAREAGTARAESEGATERLEPEPPRWGGEGVRDVEATRPQPPVSEIIFAFDPTIEGETTINYLTQQLNGCGVRLTRIARGLPVGGDLEYADPITLSDALSGRREVLDRVRVSAQSLA